MGHHFLMSTRFNKCTASDFGLVFQDGDTAINPTDDSLWVKTSLYDFGWGPENGYYRLPLPDFPKLLELALYSSNQDDAFGAASVILDKYPEELLCKCEYFANNSSAKKEFQRLVYIFDRKKAVNRCPVFQKTYDQVQSDYVRWKNLSAIASKLKVKAPF